LPLFKLLEIAVIRPALAALLLLAAPAAIAEDNAADDADIPCGYLCVDGMPLNTATDTPPDLALVKEIFVGAFSELCAWAIGGGPEMYEPELFELSYRPSWEDADAPAQPLHIYRFFCGAGAYNEQHVYYSWTPTDGVTPLRFARPAFTARYVNGDSDGALETLVVEGMNADARLVNSTFDPATGTFIEMSCWRGLCDASSRGQWVLADGEAKLVTFDIDPTYDGEITLFRVVDFTTPKPADLGSPVADIAPQMNFDEEDEAEE
jgi:hypothetical protein